MSESISLEEQAEMGMDKLKKRVVVFGWIEVVIAASSSICLMFIVMALLMRTSIASLMVVLAVPLSIYSGTLCFMSYKALHFDNVGRLITLILNTIALFHCVPLCVYFIIASAYTFLVTSDLSMLLCVAVLAVISLSLGAFSYALTRQALRDCFK